MTHKDTERANLLVECHECGRTHALSDCQEVRAEHTPGPWGREPHEDNRHALYITDERGVIIARLFNEPDEEPYQDSEANAHLIIASPHLLAAARLAVALFDRYPDTLKTGMNALRAAIARAEGRAP